MWRNGSSDPGTKAGLFKQAGLALALSIVAIAAAPLVMGPSYEQLQPRLGPLTLVIVEVLYALFIDFPLTALYVGLVTVCVGPRRNPARSGLGFVAIFFGLILACIALAPVNELLAYWALDDTFPQAVTEARDALGAPTLGLLVGSFVVFDALLCASGAVTAHVLVGRVVPVVSSETPEELRAPSSTEPTG